MFIYLDKDGNVVSVGSTNVSLEIVQKKVPEAVKVVEGPEELLIKNHGKEPFKFHRKKSYCNGSCSSHYELVELKEFTQPPPIDNSKDEIDLRKSVIVQQTVYKTASWVLPVTLINAVLWIATMILFVSR